MNQQMVSQVMFNQNFTETEEFESASTSDGPVDSSSDSSVLDNNEEYNKVLQNRIVTLRETIQILKAQLHEERETWKRELEEKPEVECTSALPVVAAAGGYEYFMDYEHDLQRYQDSLMQTHYENRQNLQKQIAFANYKRRLLEVENMCNLELLRVKQSVQILQPLQMMASEWNCAERGDFLKKSSDSDDDKTKSKSEVSMPLENIVRTVDDSDKLDDVQVGENCKIDKQSQSEPNIAATSEQV